MKPILMSGALKLRAVALLVACGAILAACGGLQEASGDSASRGDETTGVVKPAAGGGKGVAFGTSQLAAKAASSDGIGVNAYLWRAALDTLSFMPLTSADPLGGVIITDWWQPNTTPRERFKATAYILSRQLRADGIKISIFRQVDQNGQWVDAPVNATTVGDIEDKVIARARELRAPSTQR